jgi:hypothetical protein
MLASSSPERIVGNHVLLRLCVPRYPPSALINLTTFRFANVFQLIGVLIFRYCLAFVTGTQQAITDYLTSFYAVFKVLTELDLSRLSS